MRRCAAPVLAAILALSLGGCARVAGPEPAAAPGASATDGASPAGPDRAALVSAELPTDGGEEEEEDGHFAPFHGPLADGEEEHDHAEEDEEDEEHDEVEGEDEVDWASATAGPRCQPGSDPRTCPVTAVRSPLADLSESELRRRLKDDPASLGPLSIGAPNRGRLMNGVRMPEGERWKLTDPGHAWGTPETIEQITRAIDKVHAVHGSAPPMIIGHISARNGGHLRPHKSHQAGRDVDLGYYFVDPSKGWYAVANAKNLDRARTWTLVKALLDGGGAEMILIDTSIQKLLREHALSVGESPELVDQVFQFGGKSKWPVIRHVKGHATHIHVRFFSPKAQASARLAAPFLPKPAPPPADRVASSGKQPGKSGKQAGKGKAETGYVMHRARSGDTLDSLARRYGTTVAAIREANGIRGNAIKQKHTYRIPTPNAPAPTAGGAGGSSKGRARR